MLVRTVAEHTLFVVHLWVALTTQVVLALDVRLLLHLHLQRNIHIALLMDIAFLLVSTALDLLHHHHLHQHLRLHHLHHLHHHLLLAYLARVEVVDVMVMDILIVTEFVEATVAANYWRSYI